MDGLPPELLPESARWDGRARPEVWDLVPRHPAVFLLVDGSGLPIQLGATQNLRRQLQARFEAPQEARPRADVAEIARAVRWRVTHSPFESRWWYYRLARRLHPREYASMVSFGPAHFLRVDWSAAPPDIGVSERIWAQAGEFLGPWPSRRACVEALDTLRDLFDLCRYPEQVRKAPAGLRCAYFEMARCDAPCDGTAPMPGYVERVRAAWAFAAEDSGAIVESARGAMRAAAREMRFEDAARLKRRIESAERWRTLRRPMVRRERDLNHLLSIPVTRRKAYKLCLFRAGALVFSDMLSGRGSADKAAAWLEGALAAPQIVGARQRMEQTWLLAHLLERAERERVAIVPLRESATAAELLEAARAARELASKKPDAPTAAPPENEEGCEP